MAADRTVTLDLDELENVVYEMGQNHGPGDFDGECPGCSAYRKLKDALHGPDGVRACGSYECKAAQRDGVLCADGECDRENGTRPDDVEGRTK